VIALPCLFLTPFSSLFCAICGSFVSYDSWAADEEGRTVHKECLAAKRGAKKPPTPSMANGIVLVGSCVLECAGAEPRRLTEENRVSFGSKLA
jgi:hypothetical protein